MKQSTLIAAGQVADAEGQVDTASIVALDRQEDQEIVLRFMMQGRSWDGYARQVRLSKDMAQQLMEMLADELEDAAGQAGYGYMRYA